MKLCEKLVKLRKESGLTQEELAEKLFVTRTAVSKWENDKGYPGIDSLKLLSQVYNVSLDELISDDDVIAARESKKRRTSIYYWCAVACLVAAVAFAAATAFTEIPWFMIPGGVFVLGYVGLAFATRPLVSGMSRGAFGRYIASRIVVLLIVLGVLAATLVQTFF